MTVYFTVNLRPLGTTKTLCVTVTQIFWEISDFEGKPTWGSKRRLVTVNGASQDGSSRETSEDDDLINFWGTWTSEDGDVPRRSDSEAKEQVLYYYFLRYLAILTVRAKYGLRFVFDCRYSIHKRFNPFEFSHFSGFLSKSFTFQLQFPHNFLCRDWPWTENQVDFRLSLLDWNSCKRIILSHKFKICIMQIPYRN